MVSTITSSIPSTAVGRWRRIAGTSRAASTTSAYPTTSSPVPAARGTVRMVAAVTIAHVPSEPTSARATSKPSSGSRWRRWYPDTWRGMRPSSVRMAARWSEARARSSAVRCSARAAAAASSGSVARTPLRVAVRRRPSAVTRRSSSTWSAVRPWRTEWLPQASLPIAPPRQARDWLDGSGAKVRRSPLAACTAARSPVRTAPASAVTVRAASSTASTRSMCRDRSSTSPVPTAFPAIEVPPPRAVAGTPSR